MQRNEESEGTVTETTERTGSHRETKKQRENGDLFSLTHHARPHCSICSNTAHTLNISQRIRSASILPVRRPCMSTQLNSTRSRGRSWELQSKCTERSAPDCSESIYASCLQFELTARNLRYIAQRVVPIVYKGMEIEACYRVDLIVEDLVVVEAKSIAALRPVQQLLTYMGLTECPAGLLINFNVPRLMDGVKRMINPRAGAKSSLSRMNET